MSENATAIFEMPSPPESPVRCMACVTRACETIGQFPGVAHVECDAASSALRIEFDAGRVTEADLSAEMERFGLELAESVRHAAWRVTGLD